jgi:hypothetical protein
VQAKVEGIEDGKVFKEEEKSDAGGEKQVGGEQLRNRTKQILIGLIYKSLRST